MRPSALRKRQLGLAVATALSATVAAVPATAGADEFGTYVTGDFHNHTTCSDGSISMQKLVSKSTNDADVPWGLDWFVQAGHGGNGTRNCTLAEDATLATPAYPLTTIPPPAGQSNPNTTWASSIGAAAVKGNRGGATNNLPLNTLPNPAMWRWQSVQEYQYPVLEYLSALRKVPLFMGLESVVAGHEHTSMSVITDQMPASINTAPLPDAPPYTAAGNATALAQWSYCFDRGDSDNSRGQQGWDCSVPGSTFSAPGDPNWVDTAKKLFPVAPTGTNGHLKTVEAMKWMAEFHPNGSYYVPAHLERAGVFNPVGNNGFNVEHLRNFNNAAPAVAFGMETQPGHGASDARGEYTLRRNSFPNPNAGQPGQTANYRLDSAGGATYGGTGVYGAQIGGVWDALLGEGRNWWFFASSDWHNRGMFGPDDRRSSQDFFPGEYQRDYVMVDGAVGSKDLSGKLVTPQSIVDGLRTGNSWAESGQLIDRLAFVACADTSLPNAVGNALVEAAALVAAALKTDVDLGRCATMGEKLVVKPGTGIVVSIVVRDPSGTNYSPYTFPNPSLAQIGVTQPLNRPVLDHVDVIRGLVTGYKTPGAADYSGEWPRDWSASQIDADPTTNPSLASVPAGAKNTSADILRTYNRQTWKAASGAAGEFKRMTFRIRGSDVTSSQYLRLRGTNLPPSTPWETDADGNPLLDVWTNATSVAAIPVISGQPAEFPTGHFLRIPCNPAGSNVPANNVLYTGAAIDGCPNHLFADANGQKWSSFDVAAWADIWFYSNPIFIQVQGSSPVAGVE